MSGIFRIFAMVLINITMACTTQSLYESIDMMFDPEGVSKQQEERRKRLHEENRRKRRKEFMAKCREGLWQFLVAVTAAVAAGLLLHLLEK